MLMLMTYSSTGHLTAMATRCDDRWHAWVQDFVKRHPDWIVFFAEASTDHI